MIVKHLLEFKGASPQVSHKTIMAQFQKLGIIHGGPQDQELTTLITRYCAHAFQELSYGILQPACDSDTALIKSHIRAQHSSKKSSAQDSESAACKAFLQK